MTVAGNVGVTDAVTVDVARVTGATTEGVVPRVDATTVGAAAALPRPRG
ncbi:MAG: hypothetical protein MUE69_12145 [Myxococcota bacterium]|nr:hypothetical protein [Myxococcota bacterium]